jgi:hypothetical protein
MPSFSITSVITLATLLAIGQASGPTWTPTPCSPTPSPTVNLDDNTKAYMAVRREGKRQGCLNAKGLWVLSDSDCAEYEVDGDGDPYYGWGFITRPDEDTVLGCGTGSSQFKCDNSGIGTGFDIGGDTLINTHYKNRTEICQKNFWAFSEPTKTTTAKIWAGRPDVAFPVTLHFTKTLD